MAYNLYHAKFDDAAETATFTRVNARGEPSPLSTPKVVSYKAFRHAEVLASYSRHVVEVARNARSTQQRYLCVVRIALSSQDDTVLGRLANMTKDPAYMDKYIADRQPAS